MGQLLVVHKTFTTTFASFIEVTPYKFQKIKIKIMVCSRAYLTLILILRSSFLFSELSSPGGLSSCTLQRPHLHRIFARRRVERNGEKNRSAIRKQSNSLTSSLFMQGHQKTLNFLLNFTRQYIKNSNLNLKLFATMSAG